MSCLPGNWHCAKKFLLLRTSFEVRSFLCVQWCRLKQLTYANGDKMFAKYNSIGQMVDEKWQNSTGTDIAHYKYVYDGKGNIVRSIDFLGKKEYNYEYEDGRIVRATEADIVLSGEIVTKKTIIYTVRWSMITTVISPRRTARSTPTVTQSGRICSPDLTEKQFRTMRRATRPLISAKR